jgi:mRNA-degrading endonuclease RelE of RelBE toxin-antitoxin system
MPRYTLKSVTEADRQYANLPKATRRLADQRVQELLDNPTGNPDKQYDQQFDQWSIPIGDNKGWIIYTVVENVRLVILLRFLPGLDGRA